MQARTDGRFRRHKGATDGAPVGRVRQKQQDIAVRRRERPLPARRRRIQDDVPDALRLARRAFYVLLHVVRCGGADGKRVPVLRQTGVPPTQERRTRSRRDIKRQSVCNGRDRVVQTELRRVDWWYSFGNRGQAPPVVPECQWIARK